LGEANFSDHGANRLGASALMQGLADGYFIISQTLGHYLASTALPKVSTDAAAFADAESAVKARLDKLLSANGGTPAAEFHKRLGKVLWDHCGMARNESGLKSALEEIPKIREEFWRGVSVTGSGADYNMALEEAGRVADFLEFGELLVLDALERRESCGGHFREESQTPENEALRDDANFCHVAAWEFKAVGEGSALQATLHKEPLTFENVHLTQRSYK
jgi:succinate dehydrogenase / fumarate reductase flavoprotein subunit